MLRNHSCGGAFFGWGGDHFLTQTQDPPRASPYRHWLPCAQWIGDQSRLFFVSHTEDCFYRFSDRTRKEGMQKLQEVETKRKDQFDVWLAKQRANLAAKET